MEKTEFDSVVNDQFNICLETLEAKAREYVYGPDRLEHFKVSGAEQNIPPKAALWGMASKHITSIGGMCRTDASDLSLWNEKITDALNYLFLLRALVEEEAGSC